MLILGMCRRKRELGKGLKGILCFAASRAIPRPDSRFLPELPKTR